MAKEKVCFQKAKPGWLFFDGYCYKRGCELLINLNSLWSKINPLNLKKMLLISGNVKGQSHVLGLSAPLSHLWMDFVPAQVCYYKAMQWWSWSYRSNTTHTQTHRGAISESDCIHKLHVKLRVFTMRCGPDFETEDNTHSYSRDWSMIYFIFLFDSNGDHNSPSE